MPGLHEEAEVAVYTAGIGLDYGGPQYDRIPPDEMKSILAAFPRLEMKRRFADSVCRIGKTRPESTCDNFAASASVSCRATSRSVLWIT